MLTADDFLVAYRGYPRLPYHCFDHAMSVTFGAHALGLELQGMGHNIRLDLIDAAALFHDFVYVPGRQDNEALSAEAVGVILVDRDRQSVGRVRSIILDTKNHQPNPYDLESCCVSDADMAGFAAPWDTFVANNARIDDEFLIHGGIDPGEYAAGRRGFLEGTLSMCLAGRLFHAQTPDIEERHQRAEDNLRRVIAELP